MKPSGEDWKEINQELDIYRWECEREGFKPTSEMLEHRKIDVIRKLKSQIEYLEKPIEDYRYNPEKVFEPGWIWLDTFQQFALLASKIPRSAEQIYEITTLFAVLQNENRVKQYLKDSGDKDPAQSIRRWRKWMKKNKPEEFEKLLRI